MFVGHGLVAFGLAALAASHRGVDAERAIGLGLLAGAFATVPDVDVLHSLVAVLLAPVDPGSLSTAFWETTTVVHRGETHSLLVGLVLAVGVTASTVRLQGTTRRNRLLGPVLSVVLLGGLVLAVLALSGPLAAAVVGLAVLSGLVLAGLGARYGYGPMAILFAAMVGLLTHPFGDLVTGQPPPLLYPLGSDLVASRITLHPDPTVHLLGAFLVELTTVWFGLGVLARLSGWQLGPAVHPRALGGVVFGAAALAIPAPTLDAATPFVGSVLAVGLLGTPVGLRPGTGRWQRSLATGVAAVTVAALSFLVVYLVT